MKPIGYSLIDLKTKEEVLFSENLPLFAEFPGARAQLIAFRLGEKNARR